MTHRYLEVAQRLADQIESGTYAVGERIPSVRELGRKLDASAATVFAAYGELERRGLVEARPQSGFYVRLRPPPPLVSPTRIISDQAVLVTTADITRHLMGVYHRTNLVSLDAAAPSRELAPNVAFVRALTRATRRRPSVAAQYSNPPGYPPLRKAIARRAIDWGGSATPDDIVITSGATEAIHLCLRAVAAPGDVIAVESPTYYGVLQAIESLGMRVLELPTTPAAGLSLPHLDAALRQHRIAACFAMPSFANPLGSRMPDYAKRDLVAMLARAEIPLIEDDVAGDLAFDGARPRAAKSYDDRGLVLLCSSISKTVAPGARVGWVLPGRYRDRIVFDQWTTTAGANSSAQLGVAELMTSGDYDRHLRRFRTAVHGTVVRIIDAIQRQFPTGTAVTRPTGGMLLWVTLPAGLDAMELYRAALVDGIAITPGVLFSPRPIYRDHIRLSCALPYTPAVECAIGRLGRLVAKLIKRRG